jgi:hypothetical protein
MHNIAFPSFLYLTPLHHTGGCMLLMCWVPEMYSVPMHDCRQPHASGGEPGGVWH